jgi:hypothetical protein
MQKHIIIDMVPVNSITTTTSQSQAPSSSSTQENQINTEL